MMRAPTLVEGFTRRGLAVLLFSLFCCAAHTNVQAQGGVEHSISEVQGRVEVKRAGWNKFVRATVNMRIKNGDLFRLTGKASAKVVCADLNILVIQERSRRVDCKTTKPVFRLKLSVLRPPRGADAIAAFPVLISPRKTKLLDPRPTLRWTPVAGATTYKVRITRGTNTHWTQEVSGVTELRYPESAPALIPGTTYRVVVAAGSHNSDEEETVNLGFAVLDQETARAVRSVEEKIRALNLSETSTKFLIANLYATWGVNPEDPTDDRWALNAEAVQLLEEAAAAQPEASILRMLGDMYLSLGLIILAEKCYTHALELSEGADDVQGEALAHYALARIFMVRFNSTEKRKRLLRAKELFQSFGDTESVRKIDEDLATLKNQP